MGALAETTGQKDFFFCPSEAERPFFKLCPGEIELPQKGKEPGQFHTACTGEVGKRAGETAGILRDTGEDQSGGQRERAGMRDLCPSDGFQKAGFSPSRWPR